MADGPGRRLQRRIAVAADPPVVLDLPPDHNTLTEEEHQLRALMRNTNADERPLERTLPRNAPEREKKIFVFTKAQHTHNERENVHNWVLNEVLNSIGDVRENYLNLQAKKPVTKEILKQLRRCASEHDELLKKAHIKANKVREVRGTPLAIPAHFVDLPHLTN